MDGKKLYRTVTLDPPWMERGGGKIKRGADRHYTLLPTKEMPAVVFNSGVFNLAEHAHCYLWVTNNFLKDGLYLLDVLGFRYITNLVMPKPRAGLGQYFRGQHELVLFGVRGKGKDPSVCTTSKSLTTIIEAEATRVHSRKPGSFFELVELRSRGPFIELFSDLAGPGRLGWDRWGLWRGAGLAPGGGRLVPGPRAASLLRDSSGGG